MCDCFEYEGYVRYVETKETAKKAPSGEFERWMADKLERPAAEEPAKAEPETVPAD